MGKSSNVKLLGLWPSNFVTRARIALHLKSVEYEYLEEDFAAKSELLLKSNPIHKKVPVLIHDDEPVIESLTIVEYIDEIWPSTPSILPSHPYDRATARSLAAYIDDHWFQYLNEVGGAKDEEAMKEAVRKVEETMWVLEEAFVKCSKGKDFFGGDHIGYIDIVLGSCLVVLTVVEKLSGVTFLGEEKTPKLFRWANKFSSHEAVKGFLPDVDRLIQFAKMRYGIN